MRALVLACAVTTSVLSACGPSSKEGTCKDTLVAGDLVITEVFADFAAPAGGTGADEGKEWFEIYNASDRALDLKGLTVTHSRPDGSKAKQHIMAEVTIAPGQFFTLGNSTPDLVPPYIDYGYSADLGDLFNTDGGKLALSCGDSEIDSAEYQTVKSGHSRELTGAQFPDYTLNDDLANWCEAADAEFEDANFGTPGSDNDCTPVVIGQCTDAGAGVSRPVVSPQPGDLVITEVMPNPGASSDTTGEWFEVQVRTDVDLNGLALDRAGDTSAPDVIDAPDCIHVAAGETIVFAKSLDATMNGMLPAGAIKGTFDFALVDGSATAPGDVRILAGTTVIDAVSWTATRSGRSHQLDADLVDAIANDNESNFCDGATAYGAGDLGTPGALNEQCPLVAPPGMCADGPQLRAIVKPAAGQLVITEVMVNPKIESPAGQEWFEITNTGVTAFDLNELGLDQAAGTRAPDIIQSSNCISVAAGGFALFARSTDPTVNGMLAGVDATFGFGLSNSGGDVQVVDGATVLDAVTWGSVSTTSFDGKSIQLDPDSTTTTGNDTPANMLGNVWCLGATPYGDGTNTGTPKAANAQCP
ncbi:MAG TPA: lamin tail domain-containing protein [Kofleriaceae bacterium]|nr:lamin tail domain-containing protein [Kofleriaceae bacterium]